MSNEQMDLQAITALTHQISNACLGQGENLCWDECVFALGIAAAMLANIAHDHGDGPIESCLEHAKQRLSEGLAVKVTNLTDADKRGH